MDESEVFERGVQEGIRRALAAVEAVRLPDVASAGVVGKRAQGYRSVFVHAVKALLPEEG